MIVFTVFFICSGLAPEELRDGGLSCFGQRLLPLDEKTPYTRVGVGHVNIVAYWIENVNG